MQSKRVVIIGGGAAGLSAAYTLKQRGILPILLEANDHVGGRLAGEKVDGFSVDTGADFICSTYDVALRLCGELGLPLIATRPNLGWNRDGKWVRSLPISSIGNLYKSLPALRALGFLSPQGMLPNLRFFREIVRQSAHLSFASDSRMSELDGRETFGDYIDRIGLSKSVQATFCAFVGSAVMDQVQSSGHAYARTYVAEAMLHCQQICVPEQGMGSLAEALAEACQDSIRVSTPVRSVALKVGGEIGVIVDGGLIEADALICAVPATRVSGIIPELPDSIVRSLGKITYSTGCRLVLGFDRPIFPKGWHGAFYSDVTPPIMMLDRSVNLPKIAPPGKSTLDVFIGGDRAKGLIQLDDATIRRQVLGDMRKNPPPGVHVPADDEALFTRVYRWEEAVCLGEPGMFTAMADLRRQLRQEIPNLFLAGDYMAVPSVNGALFSGVSAAEEVAELLR